MPKGTSFSKSTVTELKMIAKNKGLKGYSSLRKEQLVSLIKGERKGLKRVRPSSRQTGGFELSEESLGIAQELLALNTSQLRHRAIDCGLAETIARSWSKDDLIEFIMSECY